MTSYLASFLAASSAAFSSLLVHSRDKLVLHRAVRVNPADELSGEAAAVSSFCRETELLTIAALASFTYEGP